MNAARANVGTRGREWRRCGASTCRIAAKRLRRPRRDARPTGHNARERGTGERRDAGAGMVAIAIVVAGQLPKVIVRGELGGQVLITSWK